MFADNYGKFSILPLATTLFGLAVFQDKRITFTDRWFLTNRNVYPHIQMYIHTTRTHQLHAISLLWFFFLSLSSLHQWQMVFAMLLLLAFIEHASTFWVCDSIFIQIHFRNPFRERAVSNQNYTRKKTMIQLEFQIIMWKGEWKRKYFIHRNITDWYRDEKTAVGITAIKETACESIAELFLDPLFMLLWFFVVQRKCSRRTSILPI